MTDLRWIGNFDAELGRGMQDFGVDIIFFSGVEGSNGSWSSVEKEARDAGWCLDEWREAAAAKLSGDKRSSDKLDWLSSLYRAELITAGEDILRMFAPLRSCCTSPECNN